VKWRGSALLMLGGGVEFSVAPGTSGSGSSTARAARRMDRHHEIVRPTGLAQFVGIEIQLEVRTELGRR
jgi:hypothetical protein